MKSAVIAISCTALAMTAAADTALAFTGNWNYSWGVTQNSTLDVGTANNRTCFLSGITGDIAVPFSSSPQSVSLTIDPSNEYKLSVQTWGLPLAAYVRCVNTAAGRTPEVTWSTGRPAQQLATIDPAHPNRRCFLTAVGAWRPNDANDSGFKVWTDNVQVMPIGNAWYIGGQQSGPAWGTARCIDVNQDLGNWKWGCGGTCTAQFPLAQDPGGATCLLTGIGGEFDTVGWTDGAYITYDPGILQFFMNTENGKTGWANCVR